MKKNFQLLKKLYLMRFGYGRWSPRGPPADSQSVGSERCVVPTIEQCRVAEWCPLSHPTPSHIMAGSVLREPWPVPPYDVLSRVLFNEHESSPLAVKHYHKQQGTCTDDRQLTIFVGTILIIRSKNSSILKDWSPLLWFLSVRFNNSYTTTHVILIFSKLSPLYNNGIT